MTGEAARGGGRSAAAMPDGAAARDGDLFRKLSFLTLFRLVSVTVLLGGSAFAAWSAPGHFDEAVAPLFRLVLATYAASLVLTVALRRGGDVALRPIAYLHLALDVAIADAVVWLTGGAGSVFVFMFLLAIVNGSILLFRRGAVAAAALSAGAYLPTALLAAAPRAGSTTLFVHAGSFAITAALASYLAEQLRRTGQRLEQREGDLAAITALHESIVQSVASGIVTVDGAGRITFLNRAGEQITGLRLSEARGEPAARWFAAFESDAGREETPFVNRRGERLRIGYARFPLVGCGGGALGTAVIFQDLTALRAMEEAVKRSERLADLGRVAAGLAHELRNPLASMAGSIELLRAAPGLAESDARLMDIVLREAARLEHLVAEFLAFSRPAAPRRERVELDRALSDTLEVFANDPAAASVRLERDLLPAPAWCDPDQLRQVLWNLLANAAHAAGGGATPGTIRVACAEAAGAGTVELAVEDDGPGIAPDDLPQIFTPFFTTKERGSGLGLAIVQRIVDAQGGSVSVDSTLGKGTRFTVRLPRAAPPGR